VPADWHLLFPAAGKVSKKAAPSGYLL